MKTKRNAVLNRSAWLGVMALVASLHTGDMAMAQATPRPPERMTYQGFIAGADGVALGNSAPKNYDVIFRIYDSEASNTPLWGEQQTVTVDKGYFSVLLGEGGAVDGVPNAGITLSSLFSGATASDRYVGFTVKGIGTGGADAEVLPRVRLLSSAYSFLASRALAANTATRIVQDNAGGADLLTGSGSNLTLNGALGVTGKNTLEFGSGVTPKDGMNGKIGYTTFTADALDIAGAGTNSASRKIKFWNEGGAAFTGPITAPSLTLSGALSAPSLDVAAFSANRVTITNLTVAGNQTNSGHILITRGKILDLGFGSPRNTEGEGTISVPAFGGGIGLDINGLGGGSSIIRLNTVWLESNASHVRFPNIVTAGFGTATSQVNFMSPISVFGGGNDGYSLWVNAKNGNALYCSGVAYSTLWATISDARIKDVVGRASADEDMEVIRRISVTNYRMKERAADDQRKHKGVLAQELQKVMPDAVSATVNAVPDILQDAVTVEASGPGGALRVRVARPHGLRPGERVRLEEDGRTRVVAVGEVPDETSFTYPGESQTPNGTSPSPKKVRVIGREVKDFLSVDYNQVFMAAVSALQGVDRRMQDLERKAAQVETLEREISELKKLVSALSTQGARSKESASVEPRDAGAAVAIAR